MSKYCRGFIHLASSAQYSHTGSSRDRAPLIRLDIESRGLLHITPDKHCYKHLQLGMFWGHLRTFTLVGRERRLRQPAGPRPAVSS